MATKLTTVNGNPFPSFAGEPLAWSIGLYMTIAEQEKDYPRARVVIRAMREYRPAQFEQERYQIVRASFNRMFGHNAQRQLDLMESA